MNWSCAAAQSAAISAASHHGAVSKSPWHDMMLGSWFGYRYVSVFAVVNVLRFACLHRPDKVKTFPVIPSLHPLWWIIWYISGATWIILFECSWSGIDPNNDKLISERSTMGKADQIRCFTTQIVSDILLWKQQHSSPNAFSSRMGAVTHPLIHSFIMLWYAKLY